MSEKTNTETTPGGETGRNPAGPRKTPHLPKPDGFRDTVESIVIAFIFAFVFRAFVVEAFVIPTGSMAPTLYGLHGQHRCASCSYPFAYGIREGPKGGTLAKTIQVRCPNCGWDGPGNMDLNQPHRRVTPASGDRILVLKWPYDIGGATLGPKRWDVVVFKDPQDGDQNFIKRLLGLPGEVLEIIDGDLYSAPVGELSEALRQALAEPRPANGQPGGRRELPADLRSELDRHLRIQRKPEVARECLWLIHYDHDYPPRREAPNFHPPVWRPQPSSGGPDGPWDVDTPVMTFSPTDDEEHTIHLTGRKIQDGYGYNLPATDQSRRVHVGDVRLKLALFPGDGEGSLSLLLAKERDEFRATIRSDGLVTLERAVHAGFRRGTSTLTSIAKGRIDAFNPTEALEIEFENVDYRVALRVNGEEVVTTSDQDYGPKIAELRLAKRGRKTPARVEISATGIPLTLRHIQVHRDVYYRADVTLDGSNPATHARNRLAGQPGWGTTDHPILLRAEPGDFFCCGDNSPQSKDSRLWWEVCPRLERRGNYNFGTVPADQMIGRAFFVYWPSGYRVFSTPYGLIPNVGRMRIIR